MTRKGDKIGAVHTCRLCKQESAVSQHEETREALSEDWSCEFGLVKFGIVKFEISLAFLSKVNLSC
jgi:hypothetical protein